jgi:hypothetical protein
MKPALLISAAVVSLPILIGLGAALKAKYEVANVFAVRATLELENASYRAATEQLAGQIMALQTAMSDLGARAALDPSLANSMDKLPAIVKSRAMGGPTAGTTLSSITPGLSSAEPACGGDAVDLAHARMAVVEYGQPLRPVHRRAGFPPGPRHLRRQGRPGLCDGRRHDHERVGRR